MLLCVSAPRRLRKVNRKNVLSRQVTGKGSDWCLDRKGGRGRGAEKETERERERERQRENCTCRLAACPPLTCCVAVSSTPTTGAGDGKQELTKSRGAKDAAADGTLQKD